MNDFLVETGCRNERYYIPRDISISFPIIKLLIIYY